MRRLREAFSDHRGVTMPELMIALTMTSIAAAFTLGSFYQYRESTTTNRAVRLISADVMLTRSLAIRARQPISLVANEVQRTYVLRDTLGNVLHQRAFDLNSDTRLTALDVATTGDSLTFDSRGVLLNGAGTQVNASRRTKMRTATFNALGRSRVN